jgi:hypothetical protein
MYDRHTTPYSLFYLSLPLVSASHVLGGGGLGWGQRPPGMRTLIIRTLDAFLSNVQHPLLPNMSVHLALRQVWLFPPSPPSPSIVFPHAM